jgi:hypothetical protein
MMQDKLDEGKERSTAGSCASTPITVSSLCGYLCERGMHAAAEEFLAAVCSAAEDAKLLDMMPPHHETRSDGTEIEHASSTASSHESIISNSTSTKVCWQHESGAVHEEQHSNHLQQKARGAAFSPYCRCMEYKTNINESIAGEGDLGDSCALGGFLQNST